MMLSRRYTMYEDHHAECRATVVIRKGEEITDHYVSPLFGTMYRRSHLRDGWYFDCQCRRCKGTKYTGWSRRIQHRKWREIRLLPS